MHKSPSAVYLAVALGGAAILALTACGEPPRWRTGDVACTKLSGDRVYVLQSYGSAQGQYQVRFPSGYATDVFAHELKECPQPR